MGFDVHLASAVRSVIWGGDPNKVAFGPVPPAFITSMCVAPGATNPGPIGASIVEQSRRIAQNLGEVAVDRGYSTKREKFCRRVHEQGIDVVMDYTSTDINHPKPIKVGRKGQRLLISCGTLFPLWLPEETQIPPEDADTDWYADRALWRWIPNQNLPNGGKQFICLQCAGKVSTTANTRKPHTPYSDGPYFPIEDEYCCVAFASAADLLRLFGEIDLDLTTEVSVLIGGGASLALLWGTRGTNDVDVVSDDLTPELRAVVAKVGKKGPNWPTYLR